MERILTMCKSHNKMEIYRYVVGNSYIYKLPLGKMVDYSVCHTGVFIKIEIPHSDKCVMELPFIPTGGILK